MAIRVTAHRGFGRAESNPPRAMEKSTDATAHRTISLCPVSLEDPALKAEHKS